MHRLGLSQNTATLFARQPQGKLPLKPHYLIRTKGTIPDARQGLRDQDDDKKLNKMIKETVNMWAQKEDRRPGYDDLAPKSTEFAKRARQHRGDKGLRDGVEHENYTAADKDRVEAEQMTSDAPGMAKENEGLRYDLPNDPKMKQHEPKAGKTGGIDQPGGYA